MKKHDAIIIVNPNANLGHAWRRAADLRMVAQEFGGADWAGTVYPTHAVSLARQAVEDGYRLIIAAGGDGTVHEIVNGLMEFPPEERPRLGVIPLGSGNDFSFALGMDPDPEVALRQIFTGQPRKTDVVLMEDDRGRREFWINSLGIGFDAVVTIYAHNLPYVSGYTMYLVSVLKTIFLNHKPARIKFTVNGEETWEDSILMLTLCNGPREGGGFLIAPDAASDDGLINWVAVQSISRPVMLYLIPRFMKGTHLGFRKVKSGTLRTLEIQSDLPLNVHFDGEVLAGFTSDLHAMKLEIFPGAVECMI